MKKLFISVFVLTLLDAAATAAGIRLGYLEEVNPVFRGLAGARPFMTCFDACLAAGALLLVLYKLRNRVHWMRTAMSAVLIIKSVLVCIHIFFAYSAMSFGYFATVQRIFFGLLFFIGIG